MIRVPVSPGINRRSTLLRLWSSPVCSPYLYCTSISDGASFTCTFYAPLGAVLPTVDQTSPTPAFSSAAPAASTSEPAAPAPTHTHTTLSPAQFKFARRLSLQAVDPVALNILTTLILASRTLITPMHPSCIYICNIRCFIRVDNAVAEEFCWFLGIWY